MKSIYKLKKYCHLFINNIFYFIVFLIGFLCGLFGREVFNIQNVFALTDISADIDYTEKNSTGYFNYYKFITDDYSKIIPYYKEHQVFERLQKFVDYFKREYSDEYGIVVSIGLNFVDDNYNTLYNGTNSSYQSRVSIMVYKLDEIEKYYFKILGRKNAYSAYFNSFGFSTNSHYGTISILFNDNSEFLTTPLTEFDTYILNNYKDDFDHVLIRSTNTSGIGSSMYFYNGNTNTIDNILYYSDTSVIFENTYYSTFATNYIFNNQIYENGDVWPDYYHWKLDNPDEKSVLDNMTKVCTDKPFTLSEKANSFTDMYLGNETFDSKIYLDYDIPSNLYPYLFDIYQYYRATDYKELITGYPYFLENTSFFNPTISLKDVNLYTYPFTINSGERKQLFLVGSPKALELKLIKNDDGTSSIDWKTFPNLDNYTVDLKNRYTYDFFVYKNMLNDYNVISYEHYKKLDSSMIKKSIENFYGKFGYELIEFKADYIEYLLTIRIETQLPDYTCFYYDNNNLSFAWATFDDNGNITGSAITNGQIQDFTLATGYDIWGNNVNNNFAEWIINENLKGPLAYLSKMIDYVWNSFPNGIKIVFISIFSLTLIFMILRMVGYYG